MWDLAVTASSFPGFHIGLASLLACLAIVATRLLSLVARSPRSRRISPPCERIVEQAERLNRQNGHENAGFLSRKAAFSPMVLPETSLPAAYAAWDTAAAALPHMIQTGELRSKLDQMPVLDATSLASLPDRYLQRAATILGILSHAYMRLEGEVPLTIKFDTHAAVLPKSLYMPWNQVCQRLGRPGTQAALSYIDLVVYNFTSTRGTCENLTLENSGLLVPTVNNQEERTFYGAMIEINSKVVPVFQHVIEAQRAVLMDDPAALRHHIQSLIPQMKEVTKSLNKISMNPASKSYVDPVVWTKTVANLAIPWLKGVTGAAGTAHPFFHMMDEFLGRKKYDTKIGKEALSVRESYPVHWQQFLEALKEVSIQGYISQLPDEEQKSLASLWASLENSYGGHWGLLGLHRRKVFGFLSVSFRIGRNSTINGLGRATARAKWTEADRELESARRERDPAAVPSERPASELPGAAPLHYSDLIQHNTAAAGYWFTDGKFVYDATAFASKHPGGKQVIALSSGQDASADLAAVAHLSDPRIRALLDKYRIAPVRRAIFGAAELQDLYEEAAWLGQKLAETENICRTTLSFLDAKMTAVDRPNELTAHKLRHLIETKTKIRDEYATALAAALDALLAALQRMPAAATRDLAPLRAALAAVQTRPAAAVEPVRFASCEWALGWFERDLERLQAMKGGAAAALRTLELLSYDTPALDASSVDTLVERLAALGGDLVQLGEQ